MKKYVYSIFICTLCTIQLSAQDSTILKSERTKNTVKSSSTPANVDSEKKYSGTQKANNQVKKSKSVNESEKIQPLPDDFPKYENTGNPEKDRADYLKRREDWIEKNPDLFNSYFDKSINDKQTNKKQEFVSSEK